MIHNMSTLTITNTTTVITTSTTIVTSILDIAVLKYYCSNNNIVY